MSARRGGATVFALCGDEAFTWLSFCLQTNAHTQTHIAECIRVRVLVLVLVCLCVCDLVAHDNVNHSTPFVAAWLHFFRCSLPAWVGHSLSLSVRVCVCVCVTRARGSAVTAEAAPLYYLTPPTADLALQC